MFEDDNLHGTKGENIAKRYLIERQGAVRVFSMEGLVFPAFDLISVFQRGKVKLIEVKVDNREHETHNVAIEYLHAGRFSGILSSEADWYIFILKDKLICMKKRDLFHFLKDGDFDERDWNGDKSQIFLVPTDQLVSAVDENNKLICDVWYYNKQEEHKKIGYLHEIV